MTSNFTSDGFIIKSFISGSSTSSSSVDGSVISSNYESNHYRWHYYSRLQPQKIIYIKQTKLYIEPFSDNMIITTNYLQHSDRSYPFKYLKTLQIIKLQRRPSIITQKTTNLLGLIAISLGLILMLSPMLLLFRIFGLLNVVVSMGYLIRFYWNITHQQIGEYGLLIEIQHDVQRVITSHSLKAIQMTYRAVLARLENSEPIDGILFVDMYTGEVHSDCQAQY